MADDATDIGPPRPWLVIDAKGKEAVFLRTEHARAEAYAARRHGEVFPLYLPDPEEKPS